jgi:glycosyltransferase involved in cell wall biosynthesis
VLFAAHGGEAAAYKAGGSWDALFAAVKARVPAAVGFFVGGREQGRAGDVVRLPYLDQASLGRLLAAADVLAYPTLADNHPLLILEAMAMGTPAVAYSVGGVPEQIEDGRTGRLVAPGHTAGFVAAVAGLAEHPAAATRLGGAAWQRGRTRFAAGRMTSDYLKIYESLDRSE